jgi:hypothetical protein
LFISNSARIEHPTDLPHNANSYGEISKATRELKSPDIFISYQWGKQKQVMALYDKLTKLGFTCWMDIKQNDCGDKLWANIERGISNCTVFLACMTPAYIQSDACCCELSLAKQRGKEIKPLILEKIVPWPPAGLAGPAVTQLLYISFCDIDVSDRNMWDVPKFEELKVSIEKHLPSTTLHINQSGDSRLASTNAGRDLGSAKNVDSAGRPLSCKSDGDGCSAS